MTLQARRSFHFLSICILESSLLRLNSLQKVALDIYIKMFSCLMQTSKPDKITICCTGCCTIGRKAQNLEEHCVTVNLQEQKFNSKTLETNTKTKIRLTLSSMNHKIPKHIPGLLAQRFLQRTAHMYVFTNLWIIPPNGKQLKVLAGSTVDLGVISSPMHNSQGLMNIPIHDSQLAP